MAKVNKRLTNPILKLLYVAYTGVSIDASRERDFLKRFFEAKEILSFNGILIPDRNILWTPFSLLAGRKIFGREKFDLIFFTSPPFSSNIIAHLLSKLTRKPFILDYRDDWVGNEVYSFNSGEEI